LRKRGDLAQACELWEKAVGHHRVAVQADPQQSEYRLGLRNDLSEWGRTLAQRGKPDEAVTVYRQALQTFEKLAAELPGVPDCRSDLGGLLSDLAMVYQRQKEHAQARPLLEQAIDHQQAALRANPRHPTYRQFLHIHYRLLADSLIQLGLHAELARRSEELARTFAEDREDGYRAGRYLARCVHLAEQDGQLPEPRRRDLAEAYARRAVAVLREAVRRDPGAAERLNSDKDLNPLRNTEDFKRLLAEVEPGSKPPDR
jgi:tetratricopeptide (TPR) repeat protein